MGFFFFQMALFISHVLGFFFFLALFQSILSTTVTFSEQLFLQSIFFYRGAHVWTVTSLQQLFAQNSYFSRVKLLPRSHPLRTGSSLSLLLFGTVLFLAEELFRIKISTEELLFGSRYFCTAYQLFLHFGHIYWRNP